jgi:hypothetical protein
VTADELLPDSLLLISECISIMPLVEKSANSVCVSSLELTRERMRGAIDSLYFDDLIRVIEAAISSQCH